MDRQTDIIRALTYIPNVFDKYVHYRGSELIEFKGLPVTIPSVPFIPYNDKEICSILQRINLLDGCEELSVEPLGPKGKVGIPYIIKDQKGNTMIAKLSKVDKLFASYRPS